MAISKTTLQRLLRALLSKKWKTAFGIVVIIALTVGIGELGVLPSSPNTTNTNISNEASVAVESGDVEQVTVSRIVDGDTLVVRRADGAEQKVRLIGIDTPESVSSDASRNCEEGQIASDYTKRSLPAGTTVWLTKDVSDTDRYGRLLRYVWIDDPSTNASIGPDNSTLFNAILVRDGFAQAKDYPPDTRYSADFHAMGETAIEQNLGVTSVWA